VTDEVVAEVTAWQARPLERMYRVVFFDALRVKIRDESVVQSKADLETRGCEDILIAVTDGLKDMPEALEAAYPRTTLQTCVVHLIRRSLDLVGWRERKSVARALRTIYTAPTVETATAALAAFEAGPWGQRFPVIVRAWRQAWTHVIPFFAFPPDVRRVIYTTTILESVHARLRKVITTRGHFPTDEAAVKLIWLALHNIMRGWTTKAARHWCETVHQFAILYGERFRRESV
jgi:putative transposase